MEEATFFVNNRKVLFKDTAENCALLLRDDVFALNYITNAIQQGEIPHVDPLDIGKVDIIRGENQSKESVCELNNNNDSNQNKECGRWTSKETLLLIRIVESYYEDFNKGLKRNVWGKIASRLAEMANTKFTADQCDTKFKGLKRTYKKIKDYNNTSGNNRKSWEYFEAMDSFLGRKPETTPIATCSSSTGLKVNIDADQSDDTDTSKEDKTPKRKSDLNTRHKEKLQRMDRFLNLFEKYVVNAVTENK